MSSSDSRQRLRGSRSSLLAVLALMSMITASNAGGYVSGGYSSLALSCENGRLYPFRARAISEIGEIVTGYLTLSPGRAAHMRLIPMGDGYRYAGRGIWFDGKREMAVLFLGPHHPVNCTIVRDGADVISVRG